MISLTIDRVASYYISLRIHRIKTLGDIFDTTLCEFRLRGILKLAISSLVSSCFLESDNQDHRPIILRAVGSSSRVFHILVEGGLRYVFVHTEESEVKRCYLLEDAFPLEPDELVEEISYFTRKDAL